MDLTHGTYTFTGGFTVDGIWLYNKYDKYNFTSTGIISGLCKWFKSS
ncbi:MAG: hypothetical protein IPF63_10190 [Bacteroidetes bacterium]|nr:hypothetical protein [Bacteroidota bacterium]